MNRILKRGVVGAGVFGGYHANKCATHSRTEFIGIYDPHLERAKDAVKKYNVKAFKNYQDMLDEIDVIIVACPAKHHGEMAISALEVGKHCLIEKPIAATLEEAAQIVKLAREKNLVVQVGHQERFVAKAIGLDKIDEKPLSITAQRLSKYSERGTDVSVTLDLMTHDLDLVLMLMNETPLQIESKCRSERSAFIDFSQATLNFKTGTADIIASRLEDEFRRVMEIEYSNGHVQIDFNTKTLIHNTPFDLNTNFGEDPSAKDSLGAAGNAFIEAVLDGKPVPVTAEDGYKALKLALGTEIGADN